jgi:predicted MFS family arabinose efflux permease
LILAGVLLLINWQWCFLFIGVVAIPLAIGCVFLIPTPPKRQGRRGKMDIVGVFLLTGKRSSKMGRTYVTP